MQKLINELMEFRKAESGHTSIYAEKIDIQLLVDYVSDNYTEIAEENKIDFSFKSKEVQSFTTDRNALEKLYSIYYLMHSNIHRLEDISVLKLGRMPLLEHYISVYAILVRG